MAAIIALAVNFLSLPGSGKYIILGVFSIFAWFIHFFFLTWLQAESCSGVKSFRSIAIGSLLGTLFVAGCVAIPLHIDWARLAFSDMITTHYAKLTPEVTAFASRFVAAMRQQGGAREEEDLIQLAPLPRSADVDKPPTAVDKPPTAVDKPPTAVDKPSTAETKLLKSRDILAIQKLLNEQEYNQQTIKETIYSTPAWAFLAGACGIGFGNLISGSQCS